MGSNRRRASWVFGIYVQYVICIYLEFSANENIVSIYQQSNLKMYVKFPTCIGAARKLEPKSYRCKKRPASSTGTYTYWLHGDDEILWTESEVTAHLSIYNYISYWRSVFIPTGERHYYADQQSWWKLVRRLGERQDGLLPHQLRSGHCAATQHVNYSMINCNTTFFKVGRVSTKVLFSHAMFG